jgi:hypothetical protein
VLGWHTNLCTPELSIPNDVLTVVPGWKKCEVQFDGVFDPPIALSPTDGLWAPTPPSKPPATTSTAEPANGPPVFPPKTQTESQPHTSAALVVGASSKPVPSVLPFPTGSDAGGSSLPPFTGIPLPPTPILVVNGQTVTANAQGNFVIGTQTASINAQGNIVIGTQTITSNGVPLVSISASTSKGVGDIIASFIGVGGTRTGAGTTSTVAPAQYTGAAWRVENLLVRSVFAAVGISGIVIWL